MNGTIAEAAIPYSNMIRNLTQQPLIYPLPANLSDKSTIPSRIFKLYSQFINQSININRFATDYCRKENNGDFCLILFNYNNSYSVWLFISYQFCWRK